VAKARVYARLRTVPPVPARVLRIALVWQPVEDYTGKYKHRVTMRVRADLQPSGHHRATTATTRLGQ